LQYGNVGVAEDVITQLIKIKQLQDESALEFGQRVQKLCTQLLAIIEASNRGPYEKEDRKQEAAEIGLRKFIFGLRPPLDIQVRIEKPNTLTKAIRIATDLEIQQAARRTDNGRRANTWMRLAQISQRPVYSYNNTPPFIIMKI
jgi:hypothetical protein